ncbi:MAG: hypothetical protein ACT60Q_01035, partial [Ferrovibrionaceae bacterium]
MHDPDRSACLSTRSSLLTASQHAPIRPVLAVLAPALARIVRSSIIGASIIGPSIIAGVALFTPPGQAQSIPPGIPTGIPTGIPPSTAAPVRGAVPGVAPVAPGAGQIAPTPAASPVTPAPVVQTPLAPTPLAPAPLAGPPPVTAAPSGPITAAPGSGRADRPAADPATDPGTDWARRAGSSLSGAPAPATRAYLDSLETLNDDLTMMALRKRRDRAAAEAV